MDIYENLFSNEMNILNYHEKFSQKDNLSFNELYIEYISLIKSYKSLLKQTKKIGKISDINYKLLNETKKQLKILLDSSDEGFLTFGKDFLIDSEYSQECLNIFNTNNIEKLNILELLFESNYDIEKRILEHIFSDSEKDDIYLELLPQEIKKDNRILKIKYKIINIKNEKKIMCIINDITEKKQLEKQLEEEKNNTKMLLNVLLNRDLIKKYIDDYINYVNKDVFLDIEKYTIEDFISIFYKKIHTYKGIFLQWHMIKFSQKLNKLEDDLDILKQSNIEDKEVLKKFIKKRNLESYLNYEIEIISNTLGNEFLNNDMIWIDKNKLIKLENLIKNNIQNEFSDILIYEIKKMYYMDFKNIFNMYKKYTIELAEKFDKKIDNFNININSNIIFDPDYLYTFSKSLIHIFRNIVVHGIEPPSERLKLNKSFGGNINIDIFEDKKYVHIKICDDGKGIESNYDSLDFILEDGFTTSKYSDEFSGRGIGLAAVKCIIEKINGKILIHSKINKGTCFEFLIPKTYSIGGIYGKNIDS
ncbi:ATP-binding protein [Marinitoga sp. 38H-ov]|uniref:ATP-binding protein n=1 Tax=Marinitoga sp. 38H-ov TaxID=1755814 RepID=UPI0013ED75E4|nr:ATP-binding protein [Marinitoga sp. 38H-ov]KAF2956591.1 hypothetical protein AS160_05180 [Marinitoga sp. 38H-ov]